MRITLKSLRQFRYLGAIPRPEIVTFNYIDLKTTTGMDFKFSDTCLKSASVLNFCHLSTVLNCPATSTTESHRIARRTYISIFVDKFMDYLTESSASLWEITCQVTGVAGVVISITKLYFHIIRHNLSGWSDPVQSCSSQGLKWRTLYRQRRTTL